MAGEIIDIHVHVFPDELAERALSELSRRSGLLPVLDGTEAGLLASMEEAGIGLSVVQEVSTRAKQVRVINGRLKGEVEGVMRFCAVHPGLSEEEIEEELEDVARRGIKGLKLHPVYQDVPADDIRYIRIMRKALELDMIVMIHAGYDIGFPGNDYASPERIARALEQAGDVKIILAHMGGWKAWDKAMNIFAGRKNVFIDTAFSLGKFIPLENSYWSGQDCNLLNTQQTLKMIEAFGSDKVLFGTDAPWVSQKQAVEEILSLPISQEDKDRILFKNARKLLWDIA